MATKTLEQIKQEASAATDDFFKKEEAQRKAGESASETSPEMSPVFPVADPAAGTKPKAKLFFPDVGKEGYVPSWEKDLTKPKTEPKSAEVAPPVAPESEPLQGSPEAFKKDMEAKRLVYAQLDLDKSRKWIRLKNLLGAGIKEVKDEDYDRAWGEYEEAKNKYFEAKRSDVLAKGDKEGAREFLREFEGADEAVNFLNLKYDLKKNQSGYPAKILYGFEKLANGWKEMSWKKKLAISAAIMGVGFAATATAGLTFGGVGALAFTLRTAQRTLGAGAMYIGAKKWQDTRSLKKIKEKSEAINEELLSYDDWLNRIAEIEYGQISGRFEDKKEQVEALDKKHKRRALILAAGIGIGGTAFDMYRQGYFGVIKEKLFGVGGGIVKPSVSDHISETVKPSAVQPINEAFYTHSPGGKIIGLTSQGNEHFEQFNIEPHDSPAGSYDQFQKPSGIPEPDVKTGGSLQNWVESTPAAGAEAQVPEIAKPKFEDIPVRIKAGGNMWASIENNIKANPSAYGLDQTDPNFKTNMNGKISEMLHDFAKKNGLSYKQLDKVFEGDNFKIGHDATGKPYLYDFHGKAFGADVSHGGAGATVQEIASNKPQIAHEPTVKHGAGMAEHQPSRGGQANVPDELIPQQKIAQDYRSNLAQADQELNARHPEEVATNARDLAFANDRLYLSTRGLVNQLVNGAGVGDRANFWSHSMNSWKNLLGSEYQISQDVQFNDATEKMNISLEKLRSLYPILEKYHRQGIESIGDCLKEAVKNTKDLYEINKLVLRK